MVILTIGIFNLIYRTMKNDKKEIKKTTTKKTKKAKNVKREFVEQIGTNRLNEMMWMGFW